MRFAGGRASNWRWHVGEVFVEINGKTHTFSRAVDSEGYGLESYVTQKRDKKVELEEIKAEGVREWERYLNIRAENSHLSCPH